MKKMWYISAIILIFTFLGVFNQQQDSLPNQEIILQFADAEINTDAAKETLTIVKAQLLDLGVANIQINKGKAGKLKITYYSDVDVASIKNSLSKAHIAIDCSLANQNKKDLPEFPFDEETVAYNFDVYEIQNGNDTDSGFQGTHTLEFESKTDRYLDPNLYIGVVYLTANEENRLTKIAYKVYSHIAISISDKIYDIPEIRAGPIS